MKLQRKLSNIAYMTKYFWRFGKKYLVFIFMGAFFQALQLYTEVHLIEDIVNSLIDRNFQTAIYAAVVYCAVLLVCKLYADFSYFYYPLLAAEVTRSMSMELMQKSMRLDFACFDDAAYYDAYTRASSDADGRLQRLIGTYIGMAHSVFSVLTISTLLVQLSIWYLPVVFIDVVVSLLISAKRNKIEYNFSMSNTLKFRKLAYIKNLFYDPETAKEIRIYNKKDFFANKYKAEYDEYYANLKKYNAKHECPNFIGSLVSHVCLFGNMIIAIYQVSVKSILPGAFVSTLVAFNNLKDQLLSLFSLIPDLSQQAMYIENIRKIFEYEPVVEIDTGKQTMELPDDVTIEFRNVSFKYPNSDVYVLKKLNLKLDTKKKYALVGENGAGKTTIVKLLLHLYEPTEGNIFVNGINLKELDNSEFRKLFSVVFQKYNQYKISLYENITFSENIDKQKLSDILEDVNLLDKFQKQNVDSKSQLGREFDSSGIVLSGGEAQRLSLARALYNESKVMILDEPSSSLDPIAEDRLIRTILKHSAGKLTFIISHRLSLCKDMDEIYYLENGSVAESGNHSSLMNLSGKYHDMFTMQAEKYR